MTGRSYKEAYYDVTTRGSLVRLSEKNLSAKHFHYKSLDHSKLLITGLDISSSQLFSRLHRSSYLVHIRVIKGLV